MTELIIFIAALVCLSALLSLCEVSVFSCSRVKLRQLVDKHPKLKQLSTKNKEVCAALLVSNIMVDIAGATIGGTMAFKLFGDNIEYTIYTIIVTVCLLLFSTLIPKLYASSHAYRMLRIFGSIIIFIYYITLPIVFILYSPIKPFVKDSAEAITKHEINALLTIAKSDNVITESQSNFMNKVLSLSGKSVGDLVSKDKEIHTIDIEAPHEALIEILRAGIHKRYVVTKTYKNIKYPIGIILYRDIVKQYIATNHEAKNIHIIKLMHPVTITFTETSASSLIEKLHHSQDHVCVVVDHETQSMVGVLQADDVLRYMA